MNPLPLPRRALVAGLLAALLAAPAAQAAWNTNLIVNPGADAAAGGDGYYADNLPGWNVTGELTAVSYQLGAAQGYPSSADPGPDNRGANFFAGGYTASSKGTQTIDLGFAQGGTNGNPVAGGINGTGAYYNLSGWLGGYAGQEDNAILSVSFLNAANQVIGNAAIGPVSAADRGGASGLWYREATGWVPEGAASAQVALLMSKDTVAGSANDGYADSLSFSLAAANVRMDAPTQAAVGSTFEVSVAVMTPFGGNYLGDELLAFGFDVGFDTSLVSLTGVSVAGPWDDDSAFFDDVAVAGSVFESIQDEGQDGIQLATLTFQVLAAGEVVIDVHSSAASDMNEGLTYVLGDNVDLYGRTSVVLSPVPEPGEWLMLASGLLLLVLRRRAA